MSETELIEKYLSSITKIVVGCICIVFCTMFAILLSIQFGFGILFFMVPINFVSVVLMAEAIKKLEAIRDLLDTSR